MVVAEQNGVQPPTVVKTHVPAARPSGAPSHAKAKAPNELRRARVLRPGKKSRVQDSPHREGQFSDTDDERRGAKAPWWESYPPARDAKERGSKMRRVDKFTGVAAKKLSNGMHVYFKHTDFEARQCMLIIRGRGGTNITAQV